MKTLLCFWTILLPSQQLQLFNSELRFKDSSLARIGKVLFISMDTLEHVLVNFFSVFMENWPIEEF